MRRSRKSPRAKSNAHNTLLFVSLPRLQRRIGGPRPNVNHYFIHCSRKTLAAPAAAVCFREYSTTAFGHLSKRERVYKYVELVFLFLGHERASFFFFLVVCHCGMLTCCEMFERLRPMSLKPSNLAHSTCMLKMFQSHKFRPEWSSTTLTVSVFPRNSLRKRVVRLLLFWLGLIVGASPFAVWFNVKRQEWF